MSQRALGIGALALLAVLVLVARGRMEGALQQPEACPPCPAAQPAVSFAPLPPTESAPAAACPPPPPCAACPAPPPPCATCPAPPPPCAACPEEAPAAQPALDRVDPWPCGTTFLVRGPAKSGTSLLSETVTRLWRAYCANDDSCTVTDEVGEDSFMRIQLRGSALRQGATQECRWSVTNYRGKHTLTDFHKHPHVIVLRDPRDRLVSWWFYNGGGEGAARSGAVPQLPADYAKQHVNDVIDDALPFYYDYLDEAAGKPQGERPHSFFVLYEDLVNDKAREVERLAGFWGLRLSPQSVQQVLEATTVEAMQAHEMQHGNTHDQVRLNKYGKAGSTKFVDAAGGKAEYSRLHVRSGEVGGYKKHLKGAALEVVQKAMEKKVPRRLRSSWGL